MCVGLNHIVEFGNVWVIHTLHNFDLTPNRLLSLQVFYFVFLVNFEGNFLVCLLVEAEVDQGIGTLANLLTNQVVV